MQLKKFARGWESSLRQNVMLIGVNALLAVIIVILVISVAGKHERIVLVPPQLTAEAEIGWHDADQEYRKSIALYLSTMVGNITPKTIDFTIEAISPYFSEKIYPRLRTKLLSLKHDPQFINSPVSTYFSPERIIYEQVTDRIFVIGNLISMGVKRKNTIPVTYEVIVKIKNGRPYVTYLESYKKRNPHTIKWIQSQPEEIQKKYESFLK